MLKKRIIPVVLFDGLSVIKTINFDIRRNLGSPITVAQTYNTRNVDELILIDIDATPQGRSIDKFAIRDIADECFMPLSVGGGIRSLNDVEMALSIGADKVIINSELIKNADFGRQAVAEFGQQCIVASADVQVVDSEYFVQCYHSDTKSIKLRDWLNTVLDIGFAELFMTSIDRDGTMMGLDNELAKRVAEVSTVPVVVNGGAKSAEDVAKTLSIEGVDAVGASSIFHFTDTTPDDCRLAAVACGVPVRDIDSRST